MIALIRERVRRFLEVREEQRRCPHHWHPTGMVDWECCRCGKWGDGYPKDLGDCAGPPPPSTPRH